MLSKDKRIVLFNLPVGNMSDVDVPEYVRQFMENMSTTFDDSVISFVAPTRSDDKDAIQVVSEFPIEGREAIKSILDSELSLEEKLIAIKELVEIRDGE